MFFIDTHAHLYLKEFDEDRALIIQKALESNVKKIILPNIDVNSLSQVNLMAKEFHNICLPAIGLHPCDVKENYMELLTILESQINESYVAIGETGTDAYWDKTYNSEQIDAFNIQINWAKKINKPVIIHSRETLDQNIEIIRKQQDGNLKGVFHCFTGDIDQAKEIIGLGFYLGIGGVITYKNSDVKNVLSEIGIEYVVLETDAPFLSPVPHRGKRNESGYIPYIAQSIVDACGIGLEEVANITSHNAKKLFKLSD